LFGSAPSSGKPRAAISFDDAYGGALACALPELAARRLPAIVFVAPAFIGGHGFWWDDLLDPDAPQADAMRERALTEYRGHDAEIRASLSADSHESRVLSSYTRCASRDALDRAAALDGVTLGAHSWSHPNLTRSSGDELETELRRPLAWLRERYQNVLPVLAYPYGLSAANVETAAQRAGYRAGLRLGDPWETWSLTDIFRVPRLNVPSGVSRNGFLLRITSVVRS